MPSAATRPGRLRDRATDWVWDRKLSLAILLPSLAAIALVNAWNLHGWPGRVNDDEGTYVAQAWAMVAQGNIAHYTYWYDHPFLGWAVIAGYAWVTDGFDRVATGVMVGREVMLLANLVTCALLFLLARRLGMGRAAAVGVLLLFGMSPLCVHFHRMVFLDNLAVMWTVAALAIAASRRRSLAAAFWSAACMAAAVLTKETIAILLPAVVWMLVQHTDRRTRPWNLGVFFTALVSLVAAYPLFALLKDELIPGGSHVSLSSAVWWQLFGRSGSGGLLDPASDTHRLATTWLGTDAWLLAGGVLLIPIGFVSRRLRPFAFALLVQLAVMLGGGYVPFAYVIAMLPFAALLAGGALDSLARSRPRARHRHRRLGAVHLRARWVALTAVVAVFAVFGASAWTNAIVRQSTEDGSADSRAATRWIVDNVSRDAVVVTDDYIWIDLTLAEFTHPVWLLKVDSDPQVMAEQLPNGYASIDYLVTDHRSRSALQALPTLTAAMIHSQIVVTFGTMEVRRVIGPPRRV